MLCVWQLFLAIKFFDIIVEHVCLYSVLCFKILDYLNNKMISLVIHAIGYEGSDIVGKKITRVNYVR